MSLKRAVIVPNEKFLFTQFRILLTFLIPNENSNTQLNENELGHEKTCLMSYANNKGADQPAHPHSLISAFVVRCLDSIISPVSIAEIS